MIWCTWKSRRSGAKQSPKLYNSSIKSLKMSWIDLITFDGLIFKRNEFNDSQTNHPLDRLRYSSLLPTAAAIRTNKSSRKARLRSAQLQAAPVPVPFSKQQLRTQESALYKELRRLVSQVACEEAKVQKNGGRLKTLAYFKRPRNLETA